MENPFLGLYQIMGEATEVKPSFFIAKVKAPLPNLQVQLNDIVLDKDDLLIDKWLKDRNEDIPTKDKLNANDKVILLNIDDKFIILSKVVSI